MVMPSLVTDFYEKKHMSGASQEEEDIIKNIAYTTYGGMSQPISVFETRYSNPRGFFQRPQIRQVKFDLLTFAC